MSQLLPSLELVAELVLSEREAQLRHVESLDTKAGIVLGFSGAVVALAARRSSPLAIAGTLMAAVAAALAVWTFLPRSFPVFEARALREHYLQEQPSFTRLHVLDTAVQMIEEGANLTRAKSWRLRVAMTLLVAATTLLAVDTL